MVDEFQGDATATPLVSVLIPAFNHARFVWRCLDSVLEDPYPAKELVIIDDGSTDGTGDRIAEWVEGHRDRITIQFFRRDNKGVVATLNELAVRAHGKFLRPGASDDYLLPGGLAAQVNYLQSHPEKGAVIGDSIVVDQEGDKLHDSVMCDLHGADKRLYYSDDGIRRAVISRWAIGGPVALIRKDSLDTMARWSEGLRIDDWDLFLRLAACGALGFVDVAVCAYRIHGTNLSKTRHTRTRVLHLQESLRVVLSRAGLFDEPFRTLIRAQAHYISAKISFLERRLWSTAMHLTAYAALLAASKTPWVSASPQAEQA